MSLKSIDMQFAVQKSTETGMKQNQLQHKPALDQANLATQEEKNIELTRQKSSKLEETLNHQIRDDQQNGKNNWLKQNQKKRNNKSTDVEKLHTAANLEHPYKGRHIDLSL
jgi:hypothetical protein